VPHENYTTLTTDSHYVNALTNKALALGRLGNFTGAILYYDKALAIQPNDTYALIGKGTALGRLGNFTGAILYYDKALAIQPNDTYALTSKGLALDNLGNFTGAILYYDKALAIQPNDTYALDNKAAALDNHTVAIEYIDKALHKNAFLHEVIKSFPGDNIYLSMTVSHK
jgi:Flp pilus assembly protein TadD